MMICKIVGVNQAGKEVSIVSTTDRISKWIEYVDFEPAEFYNGDEHGNCFESALMMSIRLGDTSPLGQDAVKLCHGVGDVNDAKIKRGLHAWTEYTVDDEVWSIDASLVGGPIRIVPAATYYKVNKINGELVRRYSPKSIFEIAQKLDHCGPWERPLDASHQDLPDEACFLPEAFIGSGQ